MIHIKCKMLELCLQLKDYCFILQGNRDRGKGGNEGGICTYKTVTWKLIITNFFKKRNLLENLLQKRVKVTDL